MLIRRANERGHADHGWLNARHTFSFADYHDPAHMGFRTLRVLNEDIVAPGRGFASHPHRDMEIVTWVISGAVEHRDSMGNTGIIRPGDVQVMRAGTGVVHSEANPSPTEPLHLIQIWILPAKRGSAPAYQQRTLAAGEIDGRLVVIVGGAAARAKTPAALAMEQDAAIVAGRLGAGIEASYTVAPGRGAWLHVVSGAITLSGASTGGGGAATAALAAGDAAALEAGVVTLRGATAPGAAPAVVLLFDLM